MDYSGTDDVDALSRQLSILLGREPMGGELRAIIMMAEDRAPPAAAAIQSSGLERGSAPEQSVQPQLDPAFKNKSARGAIRDGHLAALEQKLVALEPALCEVQQQVQCDPEVLSTPPTPAFSALSCPHCPIHTALSTLPCPHCPVHTALSTLPYPRCPIHAARPGGDSLREDRCLPKENLSAYQARRPRAANRVNGGLCAGKMSCLALRLVTLTALLLQRSGLVTTDPSDAASRTTMVEFGAGKGLMARVLCETSNVDCILIDYRAVLIRHTE